MQLNFEILKDKYAIYRFKSDVNIPSWISDSDFYSVTKTKDELSIVCKQHNPLANTSDINNDWKILKLKGPLNLSLVGIIAEVSGILKESEISIFTISTYETDYILVKNQDLSKAIDSLKANGHKVSYENRASINSN
jgi:hypothetical protein